MFGPDAVALAVPIAGKWIVEMGRVRAPAMQSIPCTTETAKES